MPRPLETAGQDIGTMHFIPYQGWQQAAATPLACVIADGHSVWSWGAVHKCSQRLWTMDDGTFAWLER